MTSSGLLVWMFLINLSETKSSVVWNPSSFNRTWVQHHGEQLASQLDQRKPKLAGPPLASCSLQWWSCRQHNFYHIFPRLLVLWEYSLRLLWFCWRIQLTDWRVPSRGEQFSGEWKNSVFKPLPFDYKVFMPLFGWVFCQEQDIARQRKQEKRQTGQARPLSEGKMLGK